MQKKITTFLTYDGRAEEAVDLYTSVFPNSKITSTRRYGEAGPGEVGSLMTATFELDPEKANRVMNAMLKMSKIEIDGLRKAYESPSG